MKARLIAVTVFILLTVSYFHAQTPPKKTVTPHVSTVAKSTDPEPVSFEFAVNLDADGVASIRARRRSGMAVFSPETLNSFAKYFYTEQGVRPTPSKTQDGPSFVILPDKDSGMAAVLDAIEAIRISSKTAIRIEIESDFSILVPYKPAPSVEEKPNPLFLLVDVNQRSDLLLNNEPEGSLADTSKLEGHLKKIFESRAQNGVWRPNSNTTETTIFIRMDKSMTFASLAELTLALTKSGGAPIYLQVDEIETPVLETKASIKQ